MDYMTDKDIHRGTTQTSLYRILLVENDEHDFLTVYNLLSGEDHGKYDLSEVSDFQEGLDHLKTGRFDVCFVCDNLGQRSGVEFIREARRINLSTPIILLVDPENQSLSNSELESENIDYFNKDTLDKSLLTGLIRLCASRKAAEDRQRESGRQYKDVIDNANMSICILQDGRLKYVNACIEKSSGYSREELLSCPFVDFIYPDDREMVMEYHLSRGKSKDVPTVYVFRYIDKSGKIHWVECKSIQVFWEEVPSSLIFLNDISEMKKAHEELAKAQALMLAAIEQTPAGIIIAEAPDVKIRLTNLIAQEILGDSRGPMIGMIAKEFAKQWEAKHPDGSPFKEEEMPLSRAISNGETQENLDIILRNIDGEEKWLFANAAPIRDEKGDIKAGILVFQDITEIKKKENALRESEALYRALFETAGDAIFLMQYDCFVDCNPYALKMLACTRDEIIGKTPFDFSPEIQPDGVSSKEKGRNLIESVLAGKEEHFEWTHCRLDKSLVETEVNLCRMGNGADGFQIAIVRNITQRKGAERALVESEEKFRNIYNNAQIGLFRTRFKDGKLLECNGRFAQILGYGSVEECREKFIASEHYADPFARERMLAELETTGQTKNFESRMIAADGRIIWTRCSAHLHRDKNYLEGVAADITQEKLGFQMLRESNQKVINVLASISDGFFTLDKDLIITYFNSAAEKILNKKIAQVGGWEFLKAFPEYKNTTVEIRLWRLLEEQKPASFEFRHPSSPSDKWLEFRAYPNSDGISVYFQDITARKNYEKILEEKEFKLRSILLAAGEGVIVVNSEGLVDSFNPEAEKIFGYKTSDIYGKSIEVIIPNFLARIDKSQDQIRHGIEITGLRLNGKTLPLKITVNDMTLNGQTWHTLIAHDLTEEIRNVRKLMEVDKYSAIGTLAAGVAHEFKNHLAGIIGNASFALQYLDNDDGPALAKDTLEQVIEIGENANRIALSLLTYSHNNPRVNSYQDINKLIKDVLALIDKEARAWDIEIITEFNQIPELFISRGNFQQMILNLVLNAKQAIKKKGQITIKTVMDGDNAEIVISDTGHGIGEEDLQKIFDPFFSTKGVWGHSDINGAGLGLSICRNIVTGFGGEISVESKPGYGSTFRVRIPAPARLNSSKDDFGENQPESFFLFSSDQNTLEFCHRYINSSALKICTDMGNLDMSPDNKSLVIMDAGYPGLGELYRAADKCNQTGAKYIIINADREPEYQLQGLFGNAWKIYPGLPECLTQIGKQTQFVT